MNKKNKKLLFSIVLIIFLLLVIELKIRVNESEDKNIPLFYNKEISVYPEIYNLLNDYDSDDKNVLILGASVMQYIRDSNTFDNKGTFKIYNLAQSGHTSSDSLNKLAYLTKKGFSFDYIVFYHGVNDAKLNNFPDDLFKDDYQQYSYFKFTNKIFNYGGMFNFILNSALIKNLMFSYYKLFYYEVEFIITPEWAKFGSNIKSKQAFNNFLTQFIAIARTQNSKIIIPLFAYNIPDNYSKQLFLDRKLGYSLNLNEDIPLDIYGTPKNVIKGINLHNELAINSSNDFVVIINTTNISKDVSNFIDGIHLSESGKELLVDEITTQFKN